MSAPGFPPPPRGPQAPLEPAKLADFKLAGALGSGTTAKVYDAVHLRTGRSVAIKTLEPSQAGSEMRERFAREAVLLAGVASRHVGQILGFGFERGQPFLVLERLTGETLDAKLRRDGPVPMGLAVRWLEQLMVGVRDCHDQQIIHRDIKPSNIFVHEEGGGQVVKLIDFGVARLREVTGDEGGLTSANHVIGSMGYMAPEQFVSAKTVDFTADLYAVGVCIFRSLTGRLPFVSRSLDAVIRMKTEQKAPVMSTMAGMPRNVLLDWFVEKSLARNPAERFQSAREMLEHWWNVMVSVEDDAATDVSSGVGRIAPSHAEPLRRSMREPVSAPGPAGPSAAPPTEQANRRVDPVPLARNATATLVASSPATVRVPPSGDRTLHDASPPTVRFSDGDDEGDGLFDVPTRAHPNLRKLVEEELALHRKRKG